MGKFKLGMKEQRIICGKCGTNFESSPKRSFLGFLIFTCPSCANKITYPLTSGYRVIYWIVAIFLILYAIQGLSQGSVIVPGFLGVAAIIGLVKDRSLRKKLKMVKENSAIEEILIGELKETKELTKEQYQRIQSYKNRPPRESRDTIIIKLSPEGTYDSQDSLMEASVEATVFYNKADLRKKPSGYSEDEQDTFGLLELVDSGRVAICSKSDGVLVGEIKKEIYQDSFEEKYLYYFPNGELFCEIKTKCITPRFRH